MGAMVDAGEKKEGKAFELSDAGVYAARCIQVVEIGSRNKSFKNPQTGKLENKKVNELYIVWEINNFMASGKPFTVTWRGTKSIHEKSNLYKMLKSWRGKAFSTAELAGFSLSNILDKPCMINVTKTESGGKEYNNVDTIMPLPKGMNVPDRVNDLVDFGINDINTKEFDKLWPYVQKWVNESIEGIRYNESGARDMEDDDYEPSKFEDEGEALAF